MNTLAVEPVASEIARAVAFCDGGPAAVAHELDVSKATVYTWANGTRRMPSDNAAKLEGMTGGKVTRRDMWPLSWARIWPELVVEDADTTTPRTPTTSEA